MSFAPCIPSSIATPFGIVHLHAFKKENHREHIREVLCAAAGGDVGGVVAKEGERPYFTNSPFDANWTHSAKLCVLAYSGDAIVGIDAERIRCRSTRVADRFFNAEEAAHINRCEPEAAMQEFFKLWCRKEAYYKCVGGSFFKDSLEVNMLDGFPNGVYCAEWTVEFENERYQVTLAATSRATRLQKD